jgi:hypothetical protein
VKTDDGGQVWQRSDPDRREWMTDRGTRGQKHKTSSASAHEIPHAFIYDYFGELPRAKAVRLPASTTDSIPLRVTEVLSPQA